ncbi:MFS transporter [Plantactinospora solaniradicis]|uniref:MFS transporter n=1 Tax=Plantactinospora solaniradicis TaxID=1723736 RepID=A0ABW1K421_9ACTN
MPETPDDRSRARRALAVCSLAAFMAFLDVTIVNVAFPDLQRYFPTVREDELSWVLNGYNVVFSAALVPAGRLADMVGRRRLFLIGLLLFTVASAGCAAAPSVWWLIAARIVQAIGAAAVIPSSIALLLHEYPAERRLAATSMLGACAAAAAAFGPTVGGVLIEVLDWRLVFLVNVPIGVATMVWGARVLRESADQRRGRMPDLLGAAALALGLGALALTITKGNDWGWTSPRTVGPFAGAFALIGLALWRSARHPAPVLELSLLRLRPVAAGNAALVLFSIGIYGKILVDVLYLSDVWHLRPVLTGLALAPGPLITAACAPVAGMLADRFGGKLIAGIGVVVYGLGCVWFATVPGVEPNYLTEWLPGSFLTGIGNAMAFPVLTGVAVASLPISRFATGSAVNATARQVGAALGVAVVVAILGPLGGLESRDALLSGFWCTGAASGLALFAVLALRRPAAVPPVGSDPPLPAPSAPDRVG